MASPVTPSTGRPLSITPGARVLKTPLSDETIWKRLKEAGFDEDSIRIRDKAALIAYIAKLESEIFDLQHHMGLLILERNDFTSKFEQIKASSEAAELKQKRDQAAHLSALAEARKREESLKKALGVEKECMTSIEKALHEMRAKSAETKFAAECKLADACSMVEDAQKKYMDSEAKLLAAEALQAEASQYRRAAERKLQEVEEREDDLGRRVTAFKADCDAKEKEIVIERQTLSERQKVLHQEHERLLDGQALLNQREDYVASKCQELNRLEKELENSKTRIEKELRDLHDKKSNLELTVASSTQREAVIFSIF
ncbi:protein CROWDED NUCLEI 4-like [Hevea brasiliensis]|uniref:protein CROWDED NUCLEI 4-like n=1 Tax=Hevea brasiliensis TaxID=3981 RepID=UPI0025E0B919|nr:protein CROWDED NUCLEI 4-like [Hevea brasiliensis]